MLIINNSSECFEPGSPGPRCPTASCCAIKSVAKHTWDAKQGHGVLMKCQPRHEKNPALLSSILFFCANRDPYIIPI